MKLYRLAAVDMHTAQHIVEHCLRSELTQGRTVILVTHHIRMCLPVAAFLVELAGGTVKRSGTIQELRETEQLPADDCNFSDVGNQDDNEPTVENEADAVGATPDKLPLTMKAKCSRRTRPNSSGKLIEAETRAEGRVSIKTYFTYIRAAGWLSWVITLVLMLLMRLINIANDVSVHAKEFFICS